jgi:four helix bundle protein
MMNDESKGIDLRVRTKQFALRIIRLYRAVPTNTLGYVLGKQILRSGTSVGAHYREACRARSTAEFVSKIETALQELDETLYWMELLVESSVIPAERLNNLHAEAEELIAILVASVKTAKRSSGS